MHYFFLPLFIIICFPGEAIIKPWGLSGKESTCQSGDVVQSLVWDDPLEKEMATYSGILAWEIPWTGEPEGL